ncbi:MAG: DUF4097 family beta strand repeat protein [Lachnospiraceae bacterium]|nr:DUF4097 family beta strand repeat protein [Lachnospiraceae bacterium]
MFDFFNSKIIKREYQCAQDTTDIKIVSSSDSIRVTSGDVDAVRITYCECPGKHEYELNEAERRFSLVNKKITSFLWGIYHIFLDTTMDIVVPKNYAGVLDLHCTSGRITLTDMSAGSLKSECSSGAFRASNVGIGYEANITCTSGSVKLENMAAGDITATASSGCVVIDNARSVGGLNAKTTSGVIKINNTYVVKNLIAKNSSGSIRFGNVVVDGSIAAHNTSGGVHFESLKAGGNIKLKTTSGSIKGSIVGNESDYSILSKTTSGMNNLDNSRTGSRQLDAHATSGSIKIEFINSDNA